MKKKEIGVLFGWEVLNWLGNKFGQKYFRPIWKKMHFDHYFFSCTLENKWTCATCHFLILPCFFKLVDFLETLRSPIINAFGPMSKLFFMLLVCSFEKDDFCWLFKRTCNVLTCIFQIKHFQPMLVKHEVVENWILFKTSFGWKISDKKWRF